MKLHRIHTPLTLTLLALLIGVLVPAAHHPEEPLSISGQVHAAESTQRSDRRSAADRGRIQGRMHQAAYEDTWRADAADPAYPLTTDPLTTTTEIHKIIASDGLKQDFAGSSVAVSGDTLVVGAPQEVCYSGSACLPGAVYVFYRNQEEGWTEVQKITPFDGTADDQFGVSVAIDGNTLVVGAPGAEGGGSSNQGAV